MSSPDDANRETQGDVNRNADDLAKETARIADDLARETARKALVLAEALEAMLKQVSDGLSAVRKANRRLRRLVFGLAMSFTLDLVLTGGLTYVTVTGNNLAASVQAQANAIHASQLSSCAMGNASRADNKNLWSFFLVLATTQPGQAPETPAQKAATARVVRELEIRINASYVPVDCAKLYGGN